MTSEDDLSVRRRAEFLQALTTEHFALQSGRSATISESMSRSSLYLTSVSSAVVALALASSQVRDLFVIFALAILPVVFFLGLVTYGRLLQSGVEDTIYARAIGYIRQFYSDIDPGRAAYFSELHGDRAGLRAIGLFRRWWQPFLTAAAMVFMVNAVIGGAFVAILLARVMGPPAWVAIAAGGGTAFVIALAFNRHQNRAWRRVDMALPGEKVGQP